MVSSTTNKPSWNFINKFYEKILEKANTPQAFFIYCLIAFAESSFFPIPPDLLMIPMALSNRSLIGKLALFGTIFSVLGGILGYAIGFYLFESLGQWVIETYHLKNAFSNFQKGFQEWGFWIIALKGLTPIPYKLVTIASGVTKFDFPLFIGASILARAFRFYLLAVLLWFCGEWAHVIIKKYLGWILILSLLLIVIGFKIIAFL